jgi:hypothetical protein
MHQALLARDSNSDDDGDQDPEVSAHLASQPSTIDMLIKLLSDGLSVCVTSLSTYLQWLFRGRASSSPLTEEQLSKLAQVRTLLKDRFQHDNPEHQVRSVCLPGGYLCLPCSCCRHIHYLAAYVCGPLRTRGLCRRCRIGIRILCPGSAKETVGGLLS